MPEYLPPVGRIIETCLRLDRFSYAMYREFTETFSDPGLARTFKTLAAEELSHVKFWEKLLEMASQGDIPELFEDAETVVTELESIYAKGEALQKRFRADPTGGNAFLFSCRMEFYLIHPALSTLFVFAQSFSKQFMLADTYDAHIQRFITAFRANTSSIPELDLMGESMERLWKQNRSLSRLGAMDELTGLLNRRGFFNAVKPLANMAQRSNENVGVLMVDIDDFKKVNDTHGHLKGDQVLKVLGRVLQNAGRASDVTGRYGGEEFIVFLPGILRNSPVQVAEKIRAAVDEESRPVIPVTVSIGMAEGRLSEDVNRDLLDLVKRADDALYRAKREGKNRAVSG
jgi:diguanylate cyclase (GGDEF)-like protein